MKYGLMRHSWILAVMCLMVGCPNPAADTGSDTKITKKHSSPDPDESTAPEPTDSPSDDGTTDPEPTDSPTPTPTPEPTAAPMEVLTLAGHFTDGYADGTGEAARFKIPADLDTDGSGNLYLADAGNHVIRKIVPGTMIVTTIAGKGVPGWADGKKADAMFNMPFGVAVSTDVIYVADTNNNVIRKIDLSKSETDAGYVTTIAGHLDDDDMPVDGFKDDPVATKAMFYHPHGLALVPSENMLYVADTGNHLIRAIDLEDWSVTTVAGDVTASSESAGGGLVDRFGLQGRQGGLGAVRHAGRSGLPRGEQRALRVRPGQPPHPHDRPRGHRLAGHHHRGQRLRG